jgi:hypothetical protein
VTEWIRDVRDHLSAGLTEVHDLLDRLDESGQDYDTDTIRAALAAAGAMRSVLLRQFPWLADIDATAGARSTDVAPHTVLCGWGCGFLAHSEAALDDHETDCHHDDQDHDRPGTGPVPATGMPPPRRAPRPHRKG